MLKHAPNILIYPGWNKNPYLSLLYKGQENSIFSTYAGAFFPLVRNLSKAQANIIHIHWTSALFATAEKQTIRTFLRRTIAVLDLLIVRYILRKKIIWTVHNLYPHECVALKKEQRCRKLLSRLSSAVIVLGESARKIVATEFSIPDKKIHVHKHGTFNELFEAMTPNKRSAIFEHFSIETDRKIFLLPGSVKKYKNPLNAVKVFGSWNSGVKLIIAGKVDSELKPLLKDSGNVQIIDRYLEDQELLDLYSIADWVIFPYKEILTSGSLLTAIGLGKAIIAPEIGTIPDYLDEKGGILYSVDDQDGLKKALDQTEKKDASLLGRHNSQKALTFDWADIRKQYSTLIKDILNE